MTLRYYWSIIVGRFSYVYIRMILSSSRQLNRKSIDEIPVLSVDKYTVVLFISCVKVNDRSYVYIYIYM